MSGLGDFVKGVVSDVLNDMLKKASGKRARRRKRAAAPTAQSRRIGKALKPARKQTSRKRTVRTRSKARRRAT